MRIRATAAALEVTMAAGPDGAVVTLVGVLDTSTVGKVRPRLWEQADAGQAVIVDLAGVVFVDSTGLGALVGALKRARRAGGDVVLRSPAPGLRRALETSGLDGVFAIVGRTADG